MGRRTLSVYWDATTWERARSAFFAQLDDPDAANTLVGWIAAAIREHAARPPAVRAQQAPGNGAGLRRVHVVDEDLVAVLDAAIAEDRRRSGRLLSQAAWIRAAAAAAAAEIEAAHGGLPPAPAELSRGPRPRT